MVMYYVIIIIPEKLHYSLNHLGIVSPISRLTRFDVRMGNDRWKAYKIMIWSCVLDKN